MGKVLYEPATKKKEAIGTDPIGGVEMVELGLWRCRRETTRLRRSIDLTPSRVRYGAPSALLEHAVMHGDEAERIREELRKLTESF